MQGIISQIEIVTPQLEERKRLLQENLTAEDWRTVYGEVQVMQKSLDELNAELTQLVTKNESTGVGRRYALIQISLCIAMLVVLLFIGLVLVKWALSK